MSRSYTSSKREHLGVKPDFELDGVKFVCEGKLTTLDLAELAEIAELGVDTEDPRAAAAISKFMRAVLGKNYAPFREHARSHDTTDEDLIDIMAGIMEDFAARPTGQPSSSRDGRSTTGPGWNPAPRHISLGTGVVEFRQPPTAGAAAAVQAAGSSSSQPASSSMSSSRSA
jgi:hypothetical protein